MGNGTVKVASKRTKGMRNKRRAKVAAIKREIDRKRTLAEQKKAERDESRYF